MDLLNSVKVCQLLCLSSLRIVHVHGGKTRKSDPSGTFCLIILLPDHQIKNLNVTFITISGHLVKKKRRSDFL